jgi:hypothetical protein
VEVDGTGTDKVWGKRVSTSIALSRGAGGRALESRVDGSGEGMTVEHGWTGMDNAGVEFLSASIALLRGRWKRSEVGADGAAEETGTAGARDSERGVVLSVGSDMVAEQSS